MQGFALSCRRALALPPHRNTSRRAGFDERERETEHGAASRSVLRPDLAAVGFDDGARDGETEAGALLLGR